MTFQLCWANIINIMDKDMGYTGIEDDFLVHDRFRLELKLGYGFDNTESVSHYRVETFFFVPNSLGINEGTFTKQSFYHNLQNYIRLKTPEFRLDSLVGGEASPFGRLLENMDSLIKNYEPSGMRRFKYSLKMFANILKSSGREFLEPVWPLIKDGKETVRIMQTIDSFLTYVTTASDAFKSVFSKLEVFHGEHFEIIQTYKYVDEYLSLLIEKMCFNIIEAIDKYRRVLLFPVRKKLIRMIGSETEYRKKKGYSTVVEEEGHNEDWIYRFSLLKKYVSNPLFLKVARTDMEKTFQNIWFAVAAGIAMFVFMALSALANWKYGNFTAQFILIVIVAYMFKDRLKDGIKEYMAKRFRRTVFDFQTMIYGPSHFLKVGDLRESFYFVDPSRLDPSIKNIFTASQPMDISEGKANETGVYCHVKDVTLNSGMLRDYFHMIHAINDISRYNINDLLVRMDDPDATVWSVHKGTVKKLPARRNYPVNIIMRFRMGKRIFYKGFLLSLNRDGIVNVKRLPVKEMTS